MSKIDEFKNFVKQHPTLIDYVQKDEMTWQKFYEIYDLYGEDNTAWNNYLNKKEKTDNTNTRSSTPSWTDIVDIAKNIDVGKVQNGITSLQKALGLVSDLFVKDNKTSTNTYTPRPLYRSFED